MQGAIELPVKKDLAQDTHSVQKDNYQEAGQAYVCCSTFRIAKMFVFHVSFKDEIK